MKKTLLFTVLIVLGVIIGFLIGQNVKPIEKLKIVKEQVIDTVYRPQIIKVPIEVPVPEKRTEVEPDSLIVEQQAQKIDTNLVAEIASEEDTLSIKKDEMIQAETVRIIVIKEEEIDTLLAKLLDVEPVKQSQIVVEYWESPVNYKGYKLSKNKLIIYGVEPIEAGVVYKNESTLYLEVNDLFYELKESSDFKPISTISKPKFLND